MELLLKHFHVFFSFLEINASISPSRQDSPQPPNTPTVCACSTGSNTTITKSVLSRRKVGRPHRVSQHVLAVHLGISRTISPLRNTPPKTDITTGNSEAGSTLLPAGSGGSWTGSALGAGREPPGAGSYRTGQREPLAGASALPLQL